MTDGLDFSPLTSEERESAAQVATHEGEADATRPMLPPADAEPPEAAAARLFGGTRQSLAYPTADGALAFCVCRWDFDEGRKEIRPLSWVRSRGLALGALAGRASALQSRQARCSQPAAPVIVTEGEKAAGRGCAHLPQVRLSNDIRN